MYTFILSLSLLFCTNPHLDGGFMVGRVTDTSATVSIRTTESIDVIIAWGNAPGSYSASLGPFEDLVALQFYSTMLTGLQPDHPYYFQIATRPAAGGAWVLSEVGRFCTAKSAGAPFRFAVMADEHLWPAIYLGQQRNIDLYDVTLNNIAGANADFLLSLGDFAHCEYYKGGYIQSIAEGISRYMNQRRAMEVVCRVCPFYLAIGNHEGEQGWIAIQEMSYTARRTTIPNPMPNSFYRAGPRQNYFSWVWGDATFIVLDPFTYTVNKPHQHGPEPSTLNGWDWTLGKAQYDWLWDVLQTSDTPWIFVCMHHLTSTTGEYAGIAGAYYGRGGIEVARQWVRGFRSFEWGGEDANGTNLYPTERVGWTHGPIHQMLAAKGNVVVLHGHDHFFGFQELEGVYYVECPQPSDANYEFKQDLVIKGGYLYGTFLGNSGYVTVDVSATRLVLKYRSSFLPGEGANDSIAFEEIIP